MRSLLILGPLLVLAVLATINSLMTKRDLRRFSGRSLEQVAHLRASSGALIDVLGLLALAVILDLTDSLAYTITVPIVLVVGIIDVLVRRAVLTNRARRR